MLLQLAHADQCKPTAAPNASPLQVRPIDGTAEMSGVAQALYADSRYWLAAWVLAPALCLLPDLTEMCFRRTFRPTAAEVYQEAEWMDQLQTAAAKELGLTHMDVTRGSTAAAENGMAGSTRSGVDSGQQGSPSGANQGEDRGRPCDREAL